MHRRKKWEFSPWVGKIAWRREWLPTPVFLPGRPQSLGSQRDRHDWSDLALSTYIYVYTHMKVDSEIPTDPSFTHSFTKCARKARSSETLRVGGGVGCTARKMITVLTFRDLLSNGGKWKMNTTCIPLGRFCIMIQVAEHIQESQDREWLDGKKGL